MRLSPSRACSKKSSRASVGRRRDGHRLLRRHGSRGRAVLRERPGDRHWRGAFIWRHLSRIDSAWDDLSRSIAPIEGNLMKWARQALRTRPRLRGSRSRARRSRLRGARKTVGGNRAGQDGGGAERCAGCAGMANSRPRSHASMIAGDRWRRRRGQARRGIGVAGHFTSKRGPYARRFRRPSRGSLQR